MNTDVFENACSTLLHSLHAASGTEGFSYRIDNLFYEQFGMSGNDVENMLRGDFERVV